MKLPALLGEFTNLRSLYLYRNKLISLPESISQLTNLTWLNVGGGLVSLPEWIAQLINLTDLGLYNNQLTSLPDSIGQLTNLDRLDVSYNKLKSIPESIGLLTNLTQLTINRNPLYPEIKAADKQGSAIAYLRSKAANSTHRL